MSVTRQRARREMLAVLGLAVVAAAVLLFACGRTWLFVTITQPGLPRAGTNAVGRTIAPGAFALGLAGLAGAFGVLATRRVLRVVVAVVVAGCGLGAAVTAWLGARSAPDLFGSVTDVATHVDRSAWPWVAVAAGTVLGGCGVLAAVRGRRWPGMGAKYDAPRPPARRDAEPDMWRALDRGDDPTA